MELKTLKRVYSASGGSGAALMPHTFTIFRNRTKCPLSLCDQYAAAANVGHVSAVCGRHSFKQRFPQRIARHGYGRELFIVGAYADLLSRQRESPIERIPSMIDDQNNRLPFGTGRSGPIRTTCPFSSGNPSVSTSDRNGPMRRGGKFTTQAT